MRRVVIVVVLLLVALALIVRLLGSGVLGVRWDGGEPRAPAIPAEVVAARRAAAETAARQVGVSKPRQVLFGDLHVHSTFSTDAFMMSLPLSGGDGARPVSDACDFARLCSGLDFWSINDHALALTEDRWKDTVDAMRACHDVAGGDEDPDVAVFLGWEWTQVGTTPQNHYGHKNIVLRHLDDDRIPGRPIAATIPGGSTATASPWALGLLPLTLGGQGVSMVKYFAELLEAEDCPRVPVGELPAGCIDRAPTPEDLFDRLDEWGHEAMVIPHGTTWGFYTPLGSAWDKQLTPRMHDPARQRLMEVYSGHGNSEEYRPWREIAIGAGGERRCPEPTADYLPSCWQAGEIIRKRCLTEGEAKDECEARAETARIHYLDGDITGFLAVPGQTADDWLDSGQCRDCFLPAFNYRPKSSAQYVLALSEQDAGGEPLRFRFGLMASSDNHSSRPGTGYKEYDRRDMTEQRFASFSTGLLGRSDDEERSSRSQPVGEQDALAFFGVRETERQGSFFLTGGLVAAHAEGRDRDAIWEALDRREVYGTSGPRMLLWFDLINPPGTRGAAHPMGSEVEMSTDPIFAVRAVGSFEQKPGCPDYATSGFDPDALDRLCKGECYHPSDTRRTIDRIEVVKIRPKRDAFEDVSLLIEDPWKSFKCQPDPSGCRVTFTDPAFAREGRDAVYYVRAVEEPSLAVNADPLACRDVPLDEDCLGEVEERAWSSPIFVDHGRSIATR